MTIQLFTHRHARRRRVAARLRHRVVVAMVMTLAATACTQETPPAAPPSESAPSPPPPAADAAQTAAAGPCDAAETQAEMTRCWSDEQRMAERRADEALARATEWLRQREQPDAVRMFEDAHAAWAAYRDAHCRGVAAVYAGGSMAAMQEAHCRAELAGQRTRALDTILADAN